MTDPAPYDHYRATDAADAAPGVYRVVGTPEGSVTLLRVADADGRRRNTGEVVRVSPAALAERFEGAENPGDGGLGSLVRAVAATLRSAFGR